MNAASMIKYCYSDERDGDQAMTIGDGAIFVLECDDPYNTSSELRSHGRIDQRASAEGTRLVRCLDVRIMKPVRDN